MIKENPIFISYSHKDSKWVKLLAKYLAQQEIPPWIDNQLKYGEAWAHVVAGRIQLCKVFILMASKYSNESQIVHKEVNLARSENKVIIPVLVDDHEYFEGIEVENRIRLFDTVHPKSNFVERLRDFAAPGMIPSSKLQKKRIEDFTLRLFKRILNMGFKGTNIYLGFGLNVDYGIKIEQSLSHLSMNDWEKIFMELKQNISHIDFRYGLGTDYNSLFPKASDFVNYIEERVKWSDIRYL